MRYNTYSRLLGLLDNAPMQVGKVVSIVGTKLVIELPGGSKVNCLGAANIGDRVYFRGNVIDGKAPNLPLDEIEI